jgi:hypothetical protein
VPAGLHSAGTAEFVHSDAPILPAPTALAAFVGRTLKGPVDIPVPIADFAQFTQVFGGLWSESPLSYAVEQYFEHGGTAALIVRVANGGRPPTLDLPAGDGLLSFAGLSPGRGEHLRAAVDHDGIAPGDTERFNLIVQQVRERRSERIIAQEIYRRVSLSGNGADHVARALESSRLVRLAGALPRSRPEATQAAAGPQGVGYYVADNGDGDDGRPLDEYDLIGSESIRRGMFALEGRVFNLLCMPSPDPRRDLGPQALLAASAFCRRHHALLLVEPPQDWRDGATALAGLRGAPFRASDALMFFPRVETPDRLVPGQSVGFASGGVVAGLLAAADRAATDWWNAPPPQLHQRQGCRLQASPSASESLQLAALGVNVLGDGRSTSATALPLRAMHPTTTVAGSTLSLRAQRLLSWIALSIERATRWASRERDEPDVGERACQQVLEFLDRLHAANAFQSVGLEGRPFAIADSSINDLAVTVRGEFRMVYGLGPATGRQAPLAWLLVQKATGARTQSVVVNPYALRSRA